MVAEERGKKKKIHLGRSRTLPAPAQMIMYMMFMKFRWVAEILVRVHISCT